MMATPYVLFGQSGLLGDYAEIIHALGGRIKAVVLNVPEERHPGRKCFADRLTEINEHFRSHQWPEIGVIELSQFKATPGERYTLGFHSAAAFEFARILEAAHGIELDALIHPSASLANSARCGKCVAINASAVVSSFVRVGDFNVINRGATIGHDCVLSRSVRIGPGANLASNVHVAEGAVIGIGASILEDLHIGKNAVVAAGALVTRDVRAGLFVAGMPARVVSNKP